MRLMPDILAAKRDGDELTTTDFQYICNNIMQIQENSLEHS